MVHHPDTALVILEPSSKLSEEVAKFREDSASDRLIYVTYDRDNGLAPRINPLRISGLSPSTRRAEPSMSKIPMPTSWSTPWAR